jgi:nucleotide-binding universal stress UspA family protein
VQNRLGEVNIISQIEIIEGKPAQQIIEYAQKHDVQLIVMSSHGSSGVSEWNINSTVQKVLFRAQMPVMIIRAYQETPEALQGLTYQNLLLPLDGSTRAECTLPLAESIAEAQNSKVFLVNIVEEPHLPSQTPLDGEEQAVIDRLVEISKKESDNYLQQLKEHVNIDRIETIVDCSHKPTSTLHEIVNRENIDLVLMSAHGFSGDNHWPYGKFSLNFIAFGTTPLIIIQDLSKEEFGKSVAELYAEQSKGH